MPDLRPVTITLPVEQWRQFAAAMRRDTHLQPQIGPIAWATVCTVEFHLAQVEPPDRAIDYPEEPRTPVSGPVESKEPV